MSHPGTERTGAPVDDPFALLGVPRSFRVDPAALRRAHLRRVAAVHPDHAAGGGEAGELVRLSAELNEARRVLSDPVARAEVLLRLAGVSDRDSGERSGDPMAAEFLMELMELREAADAAIEVRDAARISRLRADAESRRDALVGALAADFDDGGEAALLAARARLGSLRAVERLVARLADGLAGGEG